jgi:acetylxylan esterase
MPRCRNHSLTFSLLAAGALASSPALAAWGSFNYGGGTVDMYTPKTLKASPGMVVILHYCGGSPSSTHGWLDSLADQYGFYQIAPKANGQCFDASPGRSGEKAAIASMVDAMIQQKGVDKTRVFAAGASSGACMSQTMIASYAELFAGGSALAGVPVGAWSGGNSCGICGQNAPNKTGQQWGDIVRNADPGFTGTRPRVQLWHGTSDTTLNYPSELDAEVAQWTNVFGVTDADASKESNKPKSGWSRTSYKDKSGTVVVEVNIGQGQQHDLTGQGLWSDVVRFFGLDKDVTSVPGDAGAPDAGNAGAGGALGSGGSGGARDAGVIARDSGMTGSSGGAGGAGTTGAEAGGTPGEGGVGTGGGEGGGGVVAKGGTHGGAGGADGSGGVMASGGSSASGGAGLGGLQGTGGASAEGGASGAGGSTANGDASQNGCSCRLGGQGDRAGATLATLLLAGLALVIRFKRSRR